MFLLFRRMLFFIMRCALAFVVWLILTIALLQVPSYVEVVDGVNMVLSPIPVFLPPVLAIAIFFICKKPLTRFNLFSDLRLPASRSIHLRNGVGNTNIEAELLAIDEMDGLRFEHWCANLLSSIGYSNVEVTRGSGDQGVDILAQKDCIKYAIQCKCYSSNLGNTPVQEVNTGKAIYHCHVGVVMTNRYFTAGAIEAAAATGVLLWDRDWISSHLKMILPQASSQKSADKLSTYIEQDNSRDVQGMNATGPCANFSSLSKPLTHDQSASLSARPEKGSAVNKQFIAEAQWYAARCDEDLIGDE